ncbi:histidine kinase N-terminal 7TM domain-containing protein [Halobellus clavatus]|uniref:PAS domain S-box-containing protein n=1 Tax=Halobellus clavatus TaxID=660517 RepID=A0A1H3EBG7_9EURY|nr:histidine kinase N-terminal 7TM domain-containing protein [Halobellus clavatus]SDX76093.1 PAS domain S-box-containing protein [Halobellus clavatus]
MNDTVVVFHVLVLAVTTVVTAILAGYAWRRSEHGTRSFAALMAVFTLYSGAHLIGLLALYEPLRLLIDKVQWIGTALVPLFWILFALEYTGSEQLATKRSIGLLSVVPVLTILIVLTNPWHGLMWVRNALEPAAGLALLDQEFGPWFWVYVVYTYGLILVGTALLVRLAWVSEQLYLDQSILLFVGAVAPMIASVLTVSGLSPLQNPTLDMTPYAFVVSGSTFGYAIFRYRLFDIVPATRQLGRRSAIQDLDEGVVIVDTDRRVIYCNPTASELLDATPDEVLGQSIQSVVRTESLDFDTDDALSTFERDGSVYEVRTSPIRNRRDDLVGHTLLISDITERERRERQLKRQRDELRWLKELNSVLRGVNRVLASATSREEIERSVCNRLAEGGLYQTACIADIPTWSGDADRWTIAGDQGDPRELSALLSGDDIQDGGRSAIEISAEDEAGSWAVVPLVYRRTVYGVLGLRADRELSAETEMHEREVLTELGLTIGHAINAVENRQLLSDGTTVELELQSSDENAPLLRATLETGHSLELNAIVTDGHRGDTAYIETAGRPNRVADALKQSSDGGCRVVQADDQGGIVEWIVPERSLIGIVAGRGLNVLRLTATEDRIEYTIEVPSEREVRRLVDELQRAFPETRLEAKRQRDPTQSLDDGEALSETAVDELTDRQREALEVAYRAGYFEWPRESSAEEVAETLDISRPTFQGHLRKAEDALLKHLFDTEESRSRKER